MKFIKLTIENTGNETFVNAEKITDFQINSKVGIFHEVLESGRFERQIVRLEKNDISMNFRFYKNKYLNGQKIRILFPNLED
mgnify:CR=1 FL=1